MRKPFVTAFLVIIAISLLACKSGRKDKAERARKEKQIVNITTRDSLLFTNFKEFAEKRNISSLTDISTFFLNTVYKGGTLEVNDKEMLTVNLRELDCLTFVENVLALNLCLKNNKLCIDNFISQLAMIRYRKGIIKGYTSRLHYTSEWLKDNEQKGIIKDVTPLFKESLNYNPNVYYMSNNSSKYKHLNSPKDVNKIKKIEENINSQSFKYIPKGKIKDLRNLQNGDIILITTNMQGLDIAHLGIAVNIDGHTHLIHASSTAGKVIISKDPLYRYTNNIKHFTGIIIARTE